MNRIHLLSVPIDPVTMEEALTCVRGFLQDSSQHHVATPNNEMLVRAHRNHVFRSVLKSTSLNVPDSTGLLLMAKRTGQELPERVTGVDLLTQFCLQEDGSASVFFLGAKEGVASRAAEALQAKNPNLRIVGMYSGSPKEEDVAKILVHIARAKPSILFVAFGAPAQELWIAKHLSSLSSVKVAIGIGGAFDFLAGEKSRAPRMLQALGLEWAWRFLQEPQRAMRMWNALVVFPYLVLRYGR